MDISVGILGTIKLNYPIHQRKIETPRSHVRAEQVGIIRGSESLCN
jgi:hypothetical protein